MLLKRIIVALIFIPILTFFILWGGFLFLGLICTIIGFGLFEFYRGMKREKLLTNIGILLGMGIPFSFYLMGEKLSLIHI